ncbi:MAG: hypothetical protein ACP5PQ_05185, partial [Thermoproteota archaeon]
MTLVSAAVFVYYPVGINANWILPPVRFLDPGTLGVSVALSNDNTTAVVDAATSRDLVLDDRNAYIWDDFYTNPFSPPARLTVVGSCRPGASWVNQLVKFNATGAGSGGWHGDHMVAYYATQTPSGTSRVYLLMRTRVTSTPRRGIWKGFFLFQGSPSNYRYYTYEFWDSSESDGTKIVRFAPGFVYTVLASNTERDYGGWYLQWGVRYISSGYMQYRVYGATLSTLTVTDATYSNTPSQVGFGGALDWREVIEFDDFIAS